MPKCHFRGHPSWKLAGFWNNHFCPSMGPNGGSVAMDSGHPLKLQNSPGWVIFPPASQAGRLAGPVFCVHVFSLGDTLQIYPLGTSEHANCKLVVGDNKNVYKYKEIVSQHEHFCFEGNKNQLCTSCISAGMLNKTVDDTAL